MAENVLPSSAQLVIIGGGIVGCSAAYHLAQLGWRDVVVLDKGALPYNDGSTSHAPGGMHVTNYSRMMTQFAVESVEIYSRLPDFEPGRPMVRRVGGIEVAYTRARMEDLKRKQGVATSYGVEAHLLTPEETLAHIPILDPRVIHGSFYAPLDTNVIGWHVAGSLSNEATRIGGVQFFQHVPVVDLEVRRSHLTAIVTERGRIECENALLCANIWAPAISEKAGLVIPLLAAQHQYTISTPLPELAEFAQATGGKEIVHPILRHQDYSLYFRQHWDAYGVGNYRHEPLMVRPHDVGKTAQRPFTPEHYTVAWRAAQELIPALRKSELTHAFNGMFAFTVDGFPVMGESAVRGLWTAVGVWITHAGGVGKAIAEWMTYGEPAIDVHEADINRFLPHQKTRRYIDLRCAQNYREVYDIVHPLQPIGEPRNVRLSPFHSRLVEQGAVFFQTAGYEVAQWYEANAHLLAKYAGRIPQRNGWEARFWSPIQGAEHLEVRNNVGLFNLATLAVIEVRGPGSLAFLERLCANRIDRPAGRVIYTSMLTPRGGIQTDLTVARLGEERFWVITGGALLPRDLAWLERHAPTDGSVQIVDASSAYTAVGLWGPNARHVLARVTETDLSNAAFPYYTAREIEVGAIPVTALRISYAGEPGWELYTRSEFAAALWDALWEAGRPFELIAAGAGAFDSLRLEKGYRLWGQELRPDVNPFEAGLEWAVRLDKEDFIGRHALLQVKAVGVQRRLCCMTFDAPDGMALGKEPIFAGERCVGYVTSANYGYAVGKHILYGYLPLALAAPGTRLEVEYFGVRHRATVVAEPLYDPQMQRLKA
ncbi:FAD-dependent oxidoreductase [Caldilinea sp.]|jgi:glycine cleavage system T protein|uniref:GcvT family protein n=1 Tax=Caldilinea sp. TaxID=2293560 RepID=UPI001B210052|nr:FAD-dependent oxidoreductase [Caldilinea sp.]MBO9392040.1 FAD-dependent oxidoreductase [Caldilinea sp.]